MQDEGERRALPRRVLYITEPFLEEIHVLSRGTLTFEELAMRCSEAHFADVAWGDIPANWLSIRLDEELGLENRIKRGQRGIYENALKGGKPSLSYHGSYGSYALNMLTERRLRLGTERTRGRSGIWHGPARTAVKYAWPTIWPNCSQATMTMFELRVSARTTHAKNVFVSQKDGTYEVTAILLARYKGDLREEALKKAAFIKMRNGVNVLLK